MLSAIPLPMDAAVRNVQHRLDSARALFEAIRRISAAESKTRSQSSQSSQSSPAKLADAEPEIPKGDGKTAAIPNAKAAAPPAKTAAPPAKTAAPPAKTAAPPAKTAAPPAKLTAAPAAKLTAPAKTAAAKTAPPAAKLTALTASDALTSLAAVESRYLMATGYIMLMPMDGESNKLAARGEFVRVVAAEGIERAVDDLVAAVRRPAGAQAAALLERLTDAYGSGGDGDGAAAAAAIAVAYNQCTTCAGAEMAVDGDRSELRCESCGVVRPLEGTMFEDSDRYGQEGQKARSGTFNPNRHFQYWWQRIYACEDEKELGDPADPDNLYGEKELATMRRLVRRNKWMMQLLTVANIRDMLREIKRTELNKNTALLMKKLTTRRRLRRVSDEPFQLSECFQSTPASSSWMQIAWRTTRASPSLPATTASR